MRQNGSVSRMFDLTGNFTDANTFKFHLESSLSLRDSEVSLRPLGIMHKEGGTFVLSLTLGFPTSLPLGSKDVNILLVAASGKHIPTAM